MDFLDLRETVSNPDRKRQHNSAHESRTVHVNQFAECFGRLEQVFHAGHGFFHVLSNLGLIIITIRPQTLNQRRR